MSRYLVFLMTLSSCMVPSLIFPERVEPQVLYNQPDPRPAARIFRVTGYLPVYKVFRFESSSLAYLTDVVFFAAEPGPLGSVVTPKVTSRHWNWVRTAASNYGVRVHLGVKDLGDLPDGANMRTIAANGMYRQAFAQNLTNLVLAAGFVGADIDWEYPKGSSLDDFSLLLQEVREAFDPYGLELSIAVSPYVPLRKESYLAVDQVHLMSYDDIGPHSSMQQTRQHLAMTLKRVPASKLLLGLPFYGRASGGVGWWKSLGYNDIVKLFNPKEETDHAGGYYFNGPQTIREKSRLARRLGLGGVMVWEIGQDKTGDSSLLANIYQTAWEFYPYVALRQRND